MPSVVVDTHAIVWYLCADPRLSSRAKQFIDAAINERGLIYVPSMCLVELTYLAEKRRIAPSVRTRIVAAIESPASACTLAPLDRAVADALREVPREEVPDLPDRVIAATALALNLPLISRDGKIKASRLATVW